MRSSSRPRILSMAVFSALFAMFAGLAYGTYADSQNAEPDVRATPNFSRLTLKPANLAFKAIIFPGSPTNSETRSITIKNTGRGATNLNVTVGSPQGTNAAAFTVISGAIPAIAPGGTATVTVVFAPLTDKASRATLLISSDATRGIANRTLHLVGVARGPIPTPGGSPSATATPTTTASSSATATATATSSATPSSTPTPGPQSTNKNSSNAPGVIINGKTVTVYVPQGSDDNSTTGAEQVVIEAAASPLPSPTLIATDRVNSCTPAKTGEVVCAGQTGTVDLIPAGGGAPNIQSLGSSIPAINYAAGDCVGCGAMVDDGLNLGIISSGSGYVPITLGSGTVGTPIPVNGVNSDEVPGVDFGYDMVNHLILSASYSADPNNNFMSTPPRFHVINISNPSSPMFYEFAGTVSGMGPNYFDNDGNTCGGNPGTASDALPETTALDTITHIAYVTFHTKSACFGAPPDDIAMFDMSQIQFTTGTMGNPNTWNTPSKAVQSITNTPLNGIDAISVEPNSHLALVANSSDSTFGILVLPTASGAGNPLSSTSITDWVTAGMPNDPSGAPWTGWSEPNGLATYISPNSGKAIGVLMNNPGSGGPTYVALVDMEGLVKATRDPTNVHKVDSSVNLANYITFVKAQ
jgi:hypothetical protein